MGLRTVGLRTVGRHIRLVAALALLLLLTGGGRIMAQEAVDPVDELWIDMGMRPQLVPEYNLIARPSDIARADHVSMVDVLDEITQGRKLIVFKSVADAEVLVPRLTEKFDIIGYNLEHGPSNRPDEQADPVGSIIRMRELADRYDKELALGPDRTFAINDGVAMAPYVDIFILQVQRVQDDPATVRAFVEPLVREYRAVNPDLQVSVQIRTEGDTVQLRQLVASLTDLLDGISILTSPETVAVADSLLMELRPNGSTLAQATPETLPQSAAAANPQAAENTAEPGPAGSADNGQVTGTDPLAQSQPLAPRSTPTQNPVPTGLQSSGVKEEFDQGWFMVGSLLTIGILGGGLLIASLVYAYQNFGQR